MCSNNACTSKADRHSVMTGVVILEELFVYTPTSGGELALCVCGCVCEGGGHVCVCMHACVRVCVCVRACVKDFKLRSVMGLGASFALVVITC